MFGRQVPLPRVGQNVACVLREAWSPGRFERSGRRSHIQESARTVICSQRKWRVRCHLQCIVETFALEELSDACANRSLSGAPGIPCKAEPRCNRVVVIVLQCTVYTSSSAFESCSLAEISAGRQQQSVACIVAQRCVKSARTKGGDPVWAAIRHTQEGPTEAVFHG